MVSLISRTLLSLSGKRLVALVAILGAFGLGVYLTRTYFPRVVELTIDREILRIVEREKLVPGATVTIVKEVPGPERPVKVPVVVTKTVEIIREKPVERIVTVTKPVEVPVEVIRREWPQTITVKIGSVLVDDQGVQSWRTPAYPDLIIGQVAQGVYAVSAQQPGYKIESVTTATRIDSTALGYRPLPHLTFHPLAGVIGSSVTTLGPMIQYENWYQGGVYRVAARYNVLVLGDNSPRFVAELSWGIPIGR